MSEKTFSCAERDQLDKLAALPEDLIDTVDTPEAPPENWIHARRPENESGALDLCLSALICG
jgi:hypothetical protein